MIVGIIAATNRINVSNVAVRSNALEVQAHSQRVFDQRNIDDCLGVQCVKAGVIEHDRARKLIGWLFRCDVDTTAHRVAAKIGGLRATQHFNSLDIHDRRINGTGSHAEIIQVKPGSAGAGKAGYATNADLTTRARAISNVAGIRCLCDVFSNVREHVLFNGIGRKCGYCNRYILQILFATLGGYHNFLDRQSAALLVLILRMHTA